MEFYLSHDNIYIQNSISYFPTTPTVQFKIGELINNQTQMYKPDIFTVSADLYKFLFEIR